MSKKRANHIRRASRQRLYHFTPEVCWAPISMDERIMTLNEKSRYYGRNPLLALEDKMIAIQRPEMAEQNWMHDEVVWLTTNAAPHQPWMPGPFDPSGRIKGEVRIEVRVQDAVPWTTWAREHDFDQVFVRALNRTGGGLQSEWLVVPRTIRADEWEQVIRTQDGLVLWQREDAVR